MMRIIGDLRTIPNADIQGLLNHPESVLGLLYPESGGEAFVLGARQEGKGLIADFT